MLLRIAGRSSCGSHRERAWPRSRCSRDGVPAAEGAQAGADAGPHVTSTSNEYGAGDVEAARAR